MEGKDDELEIDLTPGMVDSHFHSLMMAEKGLDPRELLSKCIDAGLAGGIDIGTRAGDTAERLWLHREFPQILLAAGLYPAVCEQEDMQAAMDELERDIQSHPVAAVGEIGIDYHWNYGTPERQRQLIELQIDLANRYDLPIIIHNRRADRAVLETLQHKAPQNSGIMHCFSSGAEEAKKFLDLGVYISFAGNLTYRRSHELREAARIVPLDRMLVETDSPYLSPQRWRGKINHPGHIGSTYRQLSDIRNLKLQALVDQVGKNFSDLFRI